VDPKEIRIGNLIRLKEEMSAIFGVDIHPVQAVDIVDISTGKVTQEMIEPIGLSEYWLKKLGFTFDDRYRLFYNGLRVSSSFVRWEPIEGWIQLDSPIGTTTIKSVHHLQNWFFALTQQELNYKP
jgi:hypothetical protein